LGVTVLTENEWWDAVCPSAEAVAAHEALQAARARARKGNLWTPGDRFGEVERLYDQREALGVTLRRKGFQPVTRG
jgi:hypothetical protein